MVIVFMCLSLLDGSAVSGVGQGGVPQRRARPALARTAPVPGRCSVTQAGGGHFGCLALPLPSQSHFWKGFGELQQVQGHTDQKQQHRDNADVVAQLRMAGAQLRSPSLGKAGREGADAVVRPLGIARRLFPKLLGAISMVSPSIGKIRSQLRLDRMPCVLKQAYSDLAAFRPRPARMLTACVRVWQSAVSRRSQNSDGRGSCRQRNAAVPFGLLTWSTSPAVALMTCVCTFQPSPPMSLVHRVSKTLARCTSVCVRAQGADQGKETIFPLIVDT